ncbi:MAG TPA: TolC family outer membrane protein [Hyphomicrobiaceae bacterium]|nr:TolC family outer membrane protein [Hyphomicrobiaceae bacterium]
MAIETRTPLGALKRVLLSGSALAVIAAGSLEVSAQSLRDALAAAYKTNPRLDAERARLRATDEEVARAHSGYRPTISGSADMGWERRETRPKSGGDGETHPHGYALNMSQPVFRGFRTLNAVRIAEATVRAGRETLRTTEQSVLLEAVTAYMDVVRDTAIVRLRENNVQVLTRELKATQDRFSVGEVTRTDVAQATARRAAAMSALDLARSNLQSSRATFERVIGFSPAGLVDPPPHSRNLPVSQSEAINIALARSPSVVAALYREQAARFTVEQIWGELLPDVRLDASYTRRYDPSRTVDDSESATVTGRVNVPLYAAGETHARVRAAKHTHVSRIQEIEQARTEARALAIAAWSRLVAARAQLQSDMAQVEANRTALAGVREEVKVGNRTVLDVLNAEQDLLNSEVQLVTTKREIVVASYNLLSSIGRLEAAELAVTGTVYDPEAHYHDVRRKWWGISITRPDGSRESHDLWPSHGVHSPVK